jgi:hypothetical protein
MRNLAILFISLILSSCNITEQWNKKQALSSRSNNVQLAVAADDDAILLNGNRNYQTSLQIDKDCYNAFFGEMPNGKFLEKMHNEDSAKYEYSSIIFSVSYKGKSIIQNKEIESSYFGSIPDSMDGILSLGSIDYAIKNDTLVVPIGLFYPDSDCGYHILLKITPEGEICYSYEIASGGNEGKNLLYVCVKQDISDTTRTIYYLEDELLSTTIYSSPGKLNRYESILISHRYQTFIETMEDDGLQKRILIYDKEDMKLFQTEGFDLAGPYKSCSSFQILDINTENRIVNIEVSGGTIKKLTLSPIV